MILNAAKARSQTFLESLPPTRTEKFRRNCINIETICVQLLSLRPPREPTSKVVSEEGGIRFARFPRKQTLDNTYASYVSIWREAYDEICNLGVVRSNLDPANLTFTKSDLLVLDEGTRHRVHLLAVLYREAVNRNNALQRLIRTSIPLDEYGKPMVPTREIYFDPQLKVELARWVGRLENGSSEFDLDEVGLKVSRRSRPGTLILSRSVIDALKVLVAN